MASPRSMPNLTPAGVALSGRLFARGALAVAIAAAVGLSGCGRKGALEPPPGMATTTPAPTAKTRPLNAQSATPATVAGKPASSERVPPQKSFFLDWLL